MNNGHEELTSKVHLDERGQPQIGPCFGFFLPSEFPLGNGWIQACPDRNELIQCRKNFDRVVAAYEVAIGHIFECCETIKRLEKECEQIKANQPIEVASTGTTRRIDSEGRDVTDLPGLWSETDKISGL